MRAREVVHGPDHPDMPVLLSNLAGTLYIQVRECGVRMFDQFFVFILLKQACLERVLRKDRKVLLLLSHTSI